jgi:DNA helicase HerA-like ATPase
MEKLNNVQNQQVGEAQPISEFEDDLDDKPVGIIYGNIGTTEFKVAVSNSKIKRTEYIQTDHETDGVVLGQVIDLTMESNISFDKAQRISFGEDIKPGGRLTAMVSVLGFRDYRGLLQVPHTPFNAGKPVFKAEDENIKNILGLAQDKDKGAYIGLLRGHNLNVYLDLNTLVQKHVSIIAKTGSGKSYMAGVMVEELAKHKVPVVIIDPHGEYTSLIHPNIDEEDTKLMTKFGVQPKGYSDKIVEYSTDPYINLGALPLKLEGARLDASDLINMTGLKTTGVQVGILYRALAKLQISKPYYTIRDIINAIEMDKNNVKWSLINALEHLDSLGIFSDNPTPLTNLVTPGKVSVINLRGVPPNIQELVVAQFAKNLFEARKLDRIPAMMLIMEEAHSFCPQQSRAVSSQILKTIASEGRKFGLGLCVVSQRPAKIDKNVLSQCNTQMILKVTNPNDLKAIVASVEGLTSNMIDEIQRLPVSVAIVVGGTISMPIMVEVRPRETKHGGRPVEVITD